MKRFFSWLLILAMVLSMVPASSLSAWAVEEPFDTENFKGLVLTTTASDVTVELYKYFSTKEEYLQTPVYVDGKTWTARSADGSVIPAGERVTIESMEGVKLLVKSVEKKRC